jgi:hypothetical protein
VLEERLPEAPTIGRATRTALSDFYFNSWRLVPANLIWGAGALLVIGLVFAYLPLAPVAFILLALPTAGIFRMAALIARGQPVAFSDSLAAWRSFFWPALAMGIVVGGGTTVLTINAVVGLGSLDPLGWGFATLALWGLLALWAVALALWPLLVDPLRDGQPLGERLRVAATLILAAPLRYALLMLGLWFLVLASTIMFAALVTVTISFAALVMSNYALPLADRIEGRRTIVVTQ